MKVATARLTEVAVINPSMASEPTCADEPVAFVPMAAVSAESATVTVSETREISSVQNGFSYFQDGDILVAKITPCFENGKIAQVRIQQRHGFGSTEFHVVRASENYTDSRFLLHFLRQDQIRLEGQQKMTGSAGQRRVPKHFLESLEIPLPPLVGQRRIAAILDQAEMLRAKRRHALAQLDTLTESLFLDLFGHPIHNEKRWSIGELGSVARVERGKFTPRPRNDPTYYDGPFPFIQTGDISGSEGRLKLWNQTLNEKGIAVSRSFPPGTVVIAIVGATLGIRAILDVEVYCPDSVIGIQVHPDKASSEYIERVLRFWRPIFVAQAPETARANINLETLRPLRIPLPPLPLQREFAAQVSAVERLKVSQRASLAKLDALFASLQHRAFRGEL